MSNANSIPTSFRMRLGLASLVFVLAIGAPRGHAQADESAGALAPPPPSAADAHVGVPDAEPTAEPVDEPRPRWSPRRGPGPRVTLVYDRYGLRTQEGAGRVHSGGLELFFPTRMVRLGFRMEFGLLTRDVGNDDYVGRIDLVAGYQLALRELRVVPYFAGVGSAGAVIGFPNAQLPYAHAMYGGGIEGGLDLRIVRPLLVGIGFGWNRFFVAGEKDDVFALRLRLGG